MTTLISDLRFAFRMLRQHKTFTAVAVLALALGIGPNTAIFSVLYATLYAPMPYPHADQLVMVWSKLQGHRNGIAAGDFLDWQKQSTSFQGLWAWSGFSANLGGAEGPEQVNGTQSTPGQLSGLGVPPVIGRDFRPDEDQTGKDHVVVLSNRLWQRRFGGKRDLVGQTIRMNGEPYTVVGVMPSGQMDRMPNELWVPLTIKPEQINHDFHWLLAMARLKPGVSIKQAQADMDAVTKHIGEVYPQDKGWGASVEPLRNDFLGDGAIRGMYVLMGAVGFVLLIACANLTNLLLARGTAREREIAIRASIGADRSRLFRQMITEGLLVALIGGTAGVGLGWGYFALGGGCQPERSGADLQLRRGAYLRRSGGQRSGIPGGASQSERRAEAIGAQHRLRPSFPAARPGGGRVCPGADSVIRRRPRHPQLHQDHTTRPGCSHRPHPHLFPSGSPRPADGCR